MTSVLKMDSRRGGGILPQKNRSIDSVNIFERDWDVLIILDACRLNLMRKVAPEYGYIDTIDSVNSIGTATHQWMPATFESASPELLAETAYITANPFSNKFLSETTFAVLDKVWQYAWND